MTDMTPNIPEVVEELRERFERYEQALIDKNVAVLDSTFLDSPLANRPAMHEHGYGFGAIRALRVARPPGPGIQAERLRLDILPLGRGFGHVSRAFMMRGPYRIALTAQPWARMPDLEWILGSLPVQYRRPAAAW